LTAARPGSERAASTPRNARPARYEEIAAWLRDFVKRGKEGDLLPTELEIAARFGVSRMTARHAVQVIANEGLVKRTQGYGTFIAPLSLYRRRGPIESFHADISARGLNPATRLLDAAMRPASAEERDVLGVADVVGIRRLRLVNGVPIAIESAALVPACAPVLDLDLESRSLYASLRKLGHIPTTAQARIKARLPTAEEQTLLRQQEGHPVLVEDRIIFDQHQRPLDATTAVYAAERFTIEADFILGPTRNFKR